jgi:urease accessory protein
MSLTPAMDRAITRMTIDAAKLMRLQGWLSPAFPVGAYAYSHGLEWAVETGEVRDRATLVDWLEADLRYGAGRTDGIFFVEIWRAVKESSAEADQPGEPPAATDEDDRAPPRFLAIAELAELAAAMRGTTEFVLESGQQGVAFLAAVRKAWPHPELDRLGNMLQSAKITPVLPVAAGIACAVHDIELDLALPLYLHAGAANLINAAVRLIPLGQSDGLMTQAALETAIAETAAEAHQTGISGIGSAAFMIDIASMQHETQYTRLFRS